MERKELDPRWQPYIERYSSVPINYFLIKYPENSKEIKQSLELLELELKSIQDQLIEREVELNALEDEDIQLKERKNFYAWKTKALRAHRMKENQLKILQAVLLDLEYPLEQEEVIDLNKRIDSLKDLISELLELFSQTNRDEVLLLNKKLNKEKNRLKLGLKN